MISFDSVNDRLKEKRQSLNFKKNYLSIETLKVTTNEGPRQSRKVVGLFRGNQTYKKRYRLAKKHRVV